MQILPQTAEFLAHRSGGFDFKVADLATPEVNIAYGSYYLRYLLDHYTGNKVLALAAYNGGEANVNRWVARNGRSMTIDQIPFPETRAYVVKVEQAQRDYRQQAKQNPDRRKFQEAQEAFGKEVSPIHQALAEKVGQLLTERLQLRRNRLRRELRRSGRVHSRLLSGGTCIDLGNHRDIVSFCHKGG